jgi:hypothetical protein
MPVERSAELSLNTNQLSAIDTHRVVQTARKGKEQYSPALRACNNRQVVRIRPTTASTTEEVKTALLDEMAKSPNAPAGSGKQA